MLRPFFLFLLLAVGLALHAAGEKRLLGRELVPMSCEQIEKSTLWNFDNQNTVDERSRAYVRRAGNVLYENADGTCRAYLLRGDTVVYRGYNAGRKEYMLADSAAPAYCLPEGFAAPYTARGLLDVDFRLSAQGQLHCRVYGPGSLVAGGDTLRRVYVVAELHSELRSYSDSIPSIPDSLLIYKWLQPGSPFPLAMQCERGGQKHLYIADTQALIVDDADTSEGTDTEPDIVRMLEAAAVGASDGSISVDFSAFATDACIDVYLLDINGYAYLHECVAPQPGGDVSFRFPVPQTLSGRHIVALCAHDNPALNRKIFVSL